MEAPEFAERDQDADEERAEDQAVQARIGHEGGDQAALEDEAEEADQREEDEGADDIAQRAREPRLLPRGRGHVAFGRQILSRHA
jgi:hypothetical protein